MSWELDPETRSKVSPSKSAALVVVDKLCLDWPLHALAKQTTLADLEPLFSSNNSRKKKAAAMKGVATAARRRLNGYARSRYLHLLFSPHRLWLFNSTMKLTTTLPRRRPNSPRSYA